MYIYTPSLINISSLYIEYFTANRKNIEGLSFTYFSVMTNLNFQACKINQ